MKKLITKVDSTTSAGTNADSDTLPIASSSSHNRSKPNVGGWAVRKGGIHIVREEKDFCNNWGISATKEHCFFCKTPTVYWNWKTNQPVCKNCSYSHRQSELTKSVTNYSCKTLEEYIRNNKDWNDYTNEKFEIKKELSIKDIKLKMVEFRDFYGGDLLYEDEIKKSKTKKELASILEKHRSFMEDMLSDAMSHLDNFKKSVGLLMM